MTWFVEYFHHDGMQTFHEKFNQLAQDVAFQQSFTFHDG